MSARHVIVVGGGVAGITAALRCLDAGAQVTLVEVRPRLGGAAYSFERDDLTLDNGQHVFLRCCEAYRGLLARLGSDGLTELQERLEVPVLAPGRRTGVLRRGPLPAPLHLAGALARYPHLSLAERLRVGQAALALGRLDPRDPAVDRRTLGAFLAEHGQSERSVRSLWDVIALPTLNLPAAEASLALGAFVFQRGLLERADAGDVGLHRAPLSRIIGEPALRTLTEAGADVRLRWRAERVLGDPRGVTVEGPGETLTADGAIVAVPPSRAAALLPADVTGAATWPDGLAVSPIVNLHVCYDRRVFDGPFAAAVGTPVQYVFDRSDAGPSEVGQYLAVSLSGADREVSMSVDALRDEFVPALAALLPRARGAKVVRFLVTREHAATFRAAPGVQAVRPGPRTPIPGLALAGAWTATGWPATLEGAALSGAAAATVVLGAAATDPVGALA